MRACAEPSGDQEAKVAAVVVSSVVVRRAALHPAHLAVDEELDAGDLRSTQFWVCEPVDPQGEDTLSVERRGDGDRLARGEGARARAADDEGEQRD